ncbi:hypothetical protein NK718_02555 [Alsobacter sp. SYSU M60028]|uniref:UrcA family protein n=1 Tax=Alsobacter ponti TaxID=2962936 RepID=A0ABT1LAU7_9HYPH|nr:hypothetical protein [Alsobacter ponti]MCP8937383.1 hypothetical protein [Alsobacter ponti]
MNRNLVALVSSIGFAVLLTPSLASAQSPLALQAADIIIQNRLYDAVCDDGDAIAPLKGFDLATTAQACQLIDDGDED